MTLLTWDILALMGITISFLLVTVIYMLSYMFQNEFLKSWSKSEFFNVFMTLILFGTLLSLINLELFKGNIDHAKEYIDYVFTNSLYTQNRIISDVSFLSTISSLSLMMNLNAMQGMGKTSESADTGQDSSAMKDDLMSSLNSQISLSPFVSPFMTALTSIQVYSFVPITMIKLHQLLIDFVFNDVSRTFPLLLCAGLFLRAFKFTRNAGNTLIALFIALYFVMPVIYLFNQALVNVILYEEEEDFSLEDLNKIPDISFSENAGAPFVTEMVTLMASQIQTFSVSGAWKEAMTGKSSMGESLIEMVSPLGSIYTFVVRFFIEGFVLPYLAIIITLGIAREFAMSLGSNIDFSSMLRLV